MATINHQKYNQIIGASSENGPTHILMEITIKILQEKIDSLNIKIKTKTQDITTRYPYLKMCPPIPKKES